MKETMITNKEKLEALKAWLTSKGKKFSENEYSELCDMTPDLVLHFPRIYVRIGDDQSFYEKARGKAFTLFIRDTDTAGFVIEKMENCIVKATDFAHLVQKTRKEAVRRKRERQRAHEQQCMEAARRKRLKALRQDGRPKRKRIRIIRAERVFRG